MKTKNLFCLILLGFAGTLFSQALVRDADFNVGTGGEGTEAGGNVKDVYVSRQLSDGKIIVGGQFTQFNGLPAAELVRLNADGSTDASFTAAYTSFLIYSVVELEEGKLLVGGYDTTVKRLNADGSLDTSFNSQLNGSTDVCMVQKQGDKYIVSGDFVYNPWATDILYHKIARLNHDGSVDTTFNNTNFGLDSSYAKVYVLPDGKIMAFGAFSSFNGQPVSGIIRLNANGSPDTTFNVGTGVQGIVRGFTVQPDGKYIISGQFTAVNGLTRNTLARLNADGSVDETFNPPAGDRVIGESIAVQADGKVIVGGWFYDSQIDWDIPDTSITRALQRFNPDGSVYEYATGVNLYTDVKDVFIQDDGKVLVGGGFVAYGSEPVGGIVRLQEPEMGIAANNHDEVTAYPNPVSSLLNIAVNGITTDARLELFDLTGKKLYSAPAANGTINMSGYSAGVYFLKIISSERTSTQKIIKE